MRWKRYISYVSANYGHKSQLIVCRDILSYASLYDSTEKCTKGWRAGVSERVSEPVTQVASLERAREGPTNVPICEFCRERKAVYTCLPFGPMDYVVFATLGTPTRGFISVNCCDWCKQRLCSGEALSAKFHGKTFLVSTWMVPALFRESESEPSEDGAIKG